MMATTLNTALFTLSVSLLWMLAQPPTALWGVVDPSTLGTCSADVHDSFTVDGGDGWRYRTWHPQAVSGCLFAHEHGDNPALMRDAQVASEPVRFGYIGRRHGHEEPHEGFKVFIINIGDTSEGSSSLVASRSVFHMGTGGPARFTTRHHSGDLRMRRPDRGYVAYVKGMFDTGATGTICNPRKPAPVKDVQALGQPCKLNSTYEIWTGFLDIKGPGGVPKYRGIVTPAVFDPITVFNPSNPGELVYIWDTRVNAILNFPNNSRTGYRGVRRESYATVGHINNAGGPTTYYTDAMGNPSSASDPNALQQTISAHYAIGQAARSNGQTQFKLVRTYSATGIGLKN